MDRNNYKEILLMPFCVWNPFILNRIHVMRPKCNDLNDYVCNVLQKNKENKGKEKTTPNQTIFETKRKKNIPFTNQLTKKIGIYFYECKLEVEQHFIFLIFMSSDSDLCDWLCANVRDLLYHILHTYLRQRFSLFVQ